jgi:sec-independent protein translocase protein TatA
MGGQVFDTTRTAPPETGDPKARRLRTLHMPSIGPMELIIVLALALIVLGPKRLPDAGRSLGRGLREFKESVAGGGEERDELAERTADRRS